MNHLHPHDSEERDFSRDYGLWDGGEGVCCAAFQLGACSHTEVDDMDDEPIDWNDPEFDHLRLDDEPF